MHDLAAIDHGQCHAARMGGPHQALCFGIDAGGRGQWMRRGQHGQREQRQQHQDGTAHAWNSWRDRADATPARSHRHGPEVSRAGAGRSAPPPHRCPPGRRARIGTEDQRRSCLQADRLEHRQFADPDLHRRVLPAAAVHAGQGVQPGGLRTATQAFGALLHAGAPVHRCRRCAAPVRGAASALSTARAAPVSTTATASTPGVPSVSMMKPNCRRPALRPGSALAWQPGPSRFNRPGVHSASCSRLKSQRVSQRPVRSLPIAVDRRVIVFAREDRSTRMPLAFNCQLPSCHAAAHAPQPGRVRARTLACDTAACASSRP